MIIYGFELPEENAKNLSFFIKSYPDMDIIIADGKGYVGEILTYKDALKAEEVVGMVNHRRQWHPNFVSYMLEKIKRQDREVGFIHNPQHYSISSMKTVKYEGKK